jgi:hypothetical protein
MRAAKLGRDFGTAIEIIEGVKMGEKVVLNPPDSIFDGAEVRPVEMKIEEKK